MKKTLFIFASLLCCTASATTLNEAKQKIENVSSETCELTISNFTTNEYSVVLNLNVSWLQGDFKSLSGNSYLVTTSQSNGTKTANPDIAAGANTTLKTYYLNNSYTEISSISDSLTEAGQSFDSVTGAALTLAASNSSGSTLYLYLTFNDGTDLTLNANSSGYRFTGYNLSKIKVNVTEAVSSVYVYDSTLSAESVTSVSKELMTVPEPTTASLGLLALCALAWRRHRA